MFSVVAMKSRTYSSFSYSVYKRVCGSWEGAQPGRETGWPMEIFHTINIMLSLWMWIGQGAGIVSSLFCGFESALVQEFKFSGSSVFFRNFTKSAISRFSDHCSGTDGIGHWMV